VISNENIPPGDLPGTGNRTTSGGSGRREMAVALGFLALASLTLGSAVLRWRKQ
jgi:hypothetical protein